MRKLLGISLIILLSACASQTTQPDVEDLNAGGVGSGVGGSDLMGSDSGRPSYFKQLQDPNSILSQRSVYYDYDSYTVKSEYRELVLSHARFLRDNAGASVILQGNTDDRGSREYNLALGQRRADSVRNMMTLAGARDEQIESVSLGEEKPRALGNGESVWSQNRRTDILYRGE
ncbi:peptidoglycan-associated lipoprotein Pal [Nitrosomonas sp. JL21]|uniref:peptidoglycan-associated lipoprotein Pal n=1 Tax=Nitrosomonas sp. JL21 TaxID=153949 RepID=UPI001371F904|nr:peptidoglycan-associated lipoprotein Pal [Nitrosomonas sp. JL21]MBL8496459.1 peptidoglycan-associated lipoprotein Pal [Nitrosomonas sp.]MCC7090349.1 peptidoglycan-associated lipoprotein Pal [Nitrosomonas sp.]MXS78472.1 peptidoglycan-associated lipoprotein Pal [Nitrosomonas sp. JL21]